MKIYTKKGDSGSTSLFGGGSYKKDSTRIEAYGTIDELNAFIGRLLADNVLADQQDVLVRVQNTLFDIGSNLATKPGKEPPLPMLHEREVEMLETQIDLMTDKLPPLKNFILPGGSPQVANCHICRTVCRRAERRVVTMFEVEEGDPLVIKYLNRLSDYFFVLARATTHKDGLEEIKWTGRQS